MSPQFRSLLMKDWSERRQVFWTSVWIMIYYLGYCVVYEFEYRTRAFAASVYTSSLFYAFFGSILLSMSTACGEYARRTLKFSSSLPVSLSQVAWSRLIVTWFCLLGPIVIISILASGILWSGIIEQVQPRQPFGYILPSNYLPARVSVSGWEAVLFLWKSIAIAACLAIEISTIMSLAGTWCRRESTVGFIGVIVILASLITGEVRIECEQTGQWFLADWIGAIIPESLAMNWSYSELNGSRYTDLELAPFISGPLLVNLLVSYLLASCFAFRYGKKTEAERGASTKRRIQFRLPRLLPQRSLFGSGQLGSLIWLNARQSIPLALSGLCVAAMMTVIQLTGDRGQHTASASFFRELPHMMSIVGTIWSAIIAVGVFGSECRRESEEFWRSKPISPQDWFWLKFVVGLAVLLITFDVIPTLGNWLLGAPADKNAGRIWIGIAASIYCLPLHHAQAYAFTVAAICQFRRSMMAAIVGLLLFFAIDQFLESIPVHPRLSTTNVLNEISAAEQNGMPIDLLNLGYPLIYGMVAAMILLATLIARKTIVRTNGLQLTGVVALCLMSCQSVLAVEPGSPLAIEVADGIQRIEESVKVLHLKLSTKSRREYPIDTPKIRPGSKRYIPVTDNLIYDYYQVHSLVSWKSFGLDGTFETGSIFNGKRQFVTTRDGQPTVQTQNFAAPIQFPNPVDLLLKARALAGASSLSDRLRIVELESSEEQGGEGDRIIVLHWDEQWGADEVEPQGGNGATKAVRHDVHVSFNASHHYWPVKIVIENRFQKGGGIISRSEISAKDWIQSDAVEIPKFVERTILVPVETTGPSEQQSGELRTSLFDKCEVLEFETDPKLPDQVFASPLKPGVNYFDQDDRQYHQLDEAGNVGPYIPKPKGAHGAVFGYFLVSIIAGAVYLLRPQANVVRALC